MLAQSARLIAVGSLAVAAGASPVDAQDKRPDSASAAVAEGRKIFEGKAAGGLCYVCHGPNAKGVAGLAPDLTDTKWLHGDGTLAFIESLVKTGVPKPKQSAAPMLPMGGAKLKPEQVKAVAAYVYSLSHK